MDVLIKNMELPKEGSITVTIRHDGAIDVIGDMGSNLGRLIDCKAIELPLHGRLIDADKLASNYINFLSVCCPLMNIEKAKELANAVKEAVKIAPTVLEAST